MSDPVIVHVHPPRRNVTIVRAFERRAVHVTHPRKIVHVTGVGPPGPAAPPFLPDVIDGNV